MPGGVEYRSPDDRVVLRLAGLTTAQASALPLSPARLRVEADADGWWLGDESGAWRLGDARWRIHESRPRFYDPALAIHAPTPRARRVAAVLLTLLQVPGMPRLVRAWHTRRSR